LLGRIKSKRGSKNEENKEVEYLVNKMKEYYKPAGLLILSFGIGLALLLLNELMVSYYSSHIMTDYQTNLRFSYALGLTSMLFFISSTKFFILTHKKYKIEKRIMENYLDDKKHS